MKKRTRRTPDQQIADLFAKIEEIKQRAEQKKAMKDPALKHVAAALRAIGKGLDEVEDPEKRRSLEQARELLEGAATGTNGAVLVPAGRGGRRGRSSSASRVDPADVLGQLTSQQGRSCESIAELLGVETRAVSTVLKNLKNQGQVRTEGQARGTRYFAVH